MSAKILIFDLETYPILYYSWRLWDSHALEVLEYSSIISFSAKWLGGQHITKALCDYNNTKNPEKSLVTELWNLVDQADILVAHNGKAFDFGRMNSAFIKFNLPPPTPAQKVDTKKLAKEAFGFDSNSLEHLVQFLQLGEKMHTGGYDLWKECRADNPKAWAKMKKYNAYDVTLLEKVYLALRPWTSNHPNLNLYNRGEGCPKCGGPDYKIQSRGIHRAKTRNYQRFQCQTCKGWLKSIIAIKEGKATFTGI
jgi:hypothetical protein